VVKVHTTESLLIVDGHRGHDSRAKIVVKKGKMWCFSEYGSEGNVLRISDPNKLVRKEESRYVINAFDVRDQRTLCACRRTGTV